MKLFLTLTTVLLGSALLVAQEQTPEIFDVSDVVAGLGGVKDELRGAQSKEKK